MKLVKVISKKTYVNKNKKQVPCNYFALEFENGRRIPVQPIYDDWDILRFNVDKVIDLRKENNADEK